MENDLKFCITRMIYRFCSLTMTIPTLCVLFTIKTHSKSKFDTRNEFSALKLVRKKCIIKASTTKSFWAMGQTSFPIWTTVTILNFKIQGVS